MEWISVKDRFPDDKFKSYLVKNNTNLKEAFFMPDAMGWIRYYRMETSFWIESSTGKLLYGITHWMNKTDEK